MSDLTTNAPATPRSAVVPVPPPEATGPVPEATEPVLEVRGLGMWFGRHHVLDGVDLCIPQRSITAMIGPSGCGKSTLLRALNRMHEMVPGARVTGTVRLHGHDIYAAGVDPIALRRSIGMVFQRPNPFPTKSIRDNILAGPRFNRLGVRGAQADALVESALTDAGLWREVRDRLDRPAGSLSGGQQQRLCIARALAVEPDVLLMDEPCSALDPQSTARIEDLVHELRSRLAIVIVTHNMQQARRISDHTAFMTISDEGEPGRLIEVGRTDDMFIRPSDARTEAYVSGRFG